MFPFDDAIMGHMGWLMFMYIHKYEAFLRIDHISTHDKVNSIVLLLYSRNMSIDFSMSNPHLEKIDIFDGWKAALQS